MAQVRSRDDHPGPFVTPEGRELYERFKTFVCEETNKPNALFIIVDRILRKRHLINYYLPLPVINLLLVVANLLSRGSLALLILWSGCRWQSDH